jgi:transketolase
MRGDLPADFGRSVARPSLAAAQPKAETRGQPQGLASSRWRPSTTALPELLGGSADLTGSNLTNSSRRRALRVDDAGRPTAGSHVNYGVREFGMAAIMNGVALHGGFIPYGGTFLTFSDYSRNAIRMAALMKQRAIYRLHPRLHRPGRGRPHAPERWSTRPACA